MTTTLDPDGQWGMVTVGGYHYEWWRTRSWLPWRRWQWGAYRMMAPGHYQPITGGYALNWATAIESAQIAAMIAAADDNERAAV